MWLAVWNFLYLTYVFLTYLHFIFLQDPTYSVRALPFPHALLIVTVLSPLPFIDHIFSFVDVFFKGFFFVASAALPQRSPNIVVGRTEAELTKRPYHIDDQTPAKKLKSSLGTDSVLLLVYWLSLQPRRLIK